MAPTQVSLAQAQESGRLATFGRSELILDLYGTDAGAHARSAIGVAALPLNLPVVIAAELEVT